jgi:hypothetical protein
MTALITALAAALTEGLKLWNVEKAREFNKRFTETRLAILAEEAKGDSSDDAKIENLYAQLEILAVAAQNELLAAHAK